jgi:hypothetical protein
MKILAQAGFSYIFKFVFFIILALATNITLLFLYMENITALFSGNNVLLGTVTLSTIVVFPIVWLFMAKKEAFFSALFKVINESIDDLVAYVIDNFLTNDNQGKVANFLETFDKQPKIAQMILGFFFDKVDFFGEVSNLFKEKEYSDSELKLKMVEIIEEKDLFEDWEPSFMTPLLLLVANIGIVVLANHFL